MGHWDCVLKALVGEGWGGGGHGSVCVFYIFMLCFGGTGLATWAMLFPRIPNKYAKTRFIYPTSGGLWAACILNEGIEFAAILSGTTRL